MIAKDLVEAILKLNEPDLRVLKYTDHGQSAEESDFPQISYVDNDDEIIHENDLEESELYERVILI